MSLKMVDAFPSTHEIVELTDTHDSESNISGNSKKQHTGRSLKNYSIEDDIKKLFDAIEIGNSRKKEQYIRDAFSKSAMKRPMKVGPSQVSGIGISEPVSLKQALRGLCISQASEMAAVKKRMSRSGVTEAGALKRLYRAVVTEADQPFDKGKGNLVEISFLPVKTSLSNFPDTVRECGLVGQLSKAELKPFSFVTTTFNEKLPALDEIVPVKGESSITTGGHCKEQVNKLQSVSNRGFGSSKQSLKIQNFVMKKFVPKTTRPEKNHSQHNKKANNNHDSCTSESIFQTPKSIREKGCKEIDKMKMEITKADEKSSSKEKEETSQSSKSSSIGEYSSTTSYSEESHFSGNRVHMSKDLRCQAISCVKKQHGTLGLRHFKLLKKLGGGDIGNVYLSELIGMRCLFAVKVMDKDFLVSKKKMVRAQTEKEILEILDHPFLPTLFANFTTNKFSCLVMEYCPGGDLHVLRQKQLTKSFSESAARFYVAEILLALEYLHMLGVVYRDLKPENILVREDGHIMLTDFDLSLRCTSNPTLLNPSSPITGPHKKISSPCSNSSCVCLTPRFLSTSKTRKLDADVIIPLPQLLVEPTTARSNSFVGTHEYLAPEIIKGEGHGSAVDWWTFGIFLYELLYGKTPFKGLTNEETISNVVSMSLNFPECSMVSSHARDLIGKLLRKEPENRLGSVMGATDIKQHSFFEGLNWALIRCEIPPKIPKVFDLGNVLPDLGYGNKIRKEALEFECERDEVVFEMF